MTRATLNPKTGVVTVKGYLSDARILAVAIEPGKDDINFATAGARLKDGETKAKLHRLECLGEDFLDRRETAIFDAGIAQLCDCCLNLTLDDEVIKQIIGTVQVILECVGYAASALEMP